MMNAARTAFADPAVAAARLLFRLALVLLLVLTPVAELFARGPLYVFLPVGACLLIIAGVIAREHEGRLRLMRLLRTPIAGAALFLFFWAGLSLVWTPYPADAATRFIKALATGLLTFFAIWSLPAKSRAETLYLLPAGLAITAVATIVLALAAPRFFWHGADLDATLAQRCAMTLILLVWPAIGALALREKWLLAAGLAVLVTGAILATFIQVALVGLALAAIVYAIALSEPQRVGQILGFGFAALTLLAPVAALVIYAIASAGHLPHPGSGFIFAELVQRQWPRLITGHGFDFAARAVQGGVLPPDAPRSILFKLWYELGVLGALAFAVLAASVFTAAGRSPIFTAPALLAALVAGLVVAVWGAETTQIWWISLSGLEAIALALLFKALPPAKRPPAPPAESAPFDGEAEEIADLS